MWWSKPRFSASLRWLALFSSSILVVILVKLGPIFAAKLTVQVAKKQVLLPLGGDFPKRSVMVFRMSRVTRGVLNEAVQFILSKFASGEGVARRATDTW